MRGPRLEVHNAAPVAEFFITDRLTLEAHALAQRLSIGGSASVYLRGSGNSDGIVGQYIDGRVTPEFVPHNRAAGLRTPIWSKAA